MKTLSEIRGRWSGCTVACIASGPSLTKEDCELVRLSHVPTIVVNTSFRLAPWSNILYAMDACWWSEYGKEVSDIGFSGERWSHTRVVGCTPTKNSLYPPGYGNSGSYAISLAIVSGASNIILLGYDCQFSNGKKHWHPDHPGKMGNAVSIARWPRHFAMIAEYAKTRNVRIVNCTRETALVCFERGDLGQELDKCAFSHVSSLPGSAV